MIELLYLTGPDHQMIAINPAEIVSIRTPRDGHFPKGTRCLIHMVDGKFIAVVETCKAVENAIVSH